MVGRELAWVLVGVTAALLSGCADDDGASPTTASTSTSTSTAEVTSTVPATAPPDDSAPPGEAGDRELILQLWRDASSAWGDGDAAGIRSGLEFLAANNYPGLQALVDVEQCERSLVPPYTEEYTVDESTIDADDDYFIPIGDLAGQSPDGRIYRMLLDLAKPTGVEVGDAHVVIAPDGRAYLFVLYPCSRPGTVGTPLG